MKETRHKASHIVWCHLLKISKIGKSLTKSKGLATRSWGEEIIESDANVLKLESVMVVHLCEYTKNHRIVYFKKVNYMVCKLCELYLKNGIMKQ